jgi:hypothetical protein
MSDESPSPEPPTTVATAQVEHFPSVASDPVSSLSSIIDSHCPVRASRALQQALSPAKISTGFFLGAGCPLAVRVVTDNGNFPLIPDIAGLTSLVGTSLKDSAQLEHYELVQTQLLEDGVTTPNLEDILSHVRALRIAAGTSEARGLTSCELQELDEALCREIDCAVRRELTTIDTPYHHLAAWIGAIERERPVQLFTTNYDLLLEQALEEMRVPYFDGFVGSFRTFFDPASMDLANLPPRWARLWKLHGSINWRQDANGRVIRSNADNSGSARLIHPSHLKYDESRRMPYLAMIDRLRSFLREMPAVLVTCGYSFGDQHLNEIISEGLQANPNAVCYALLFGALEGYPIAKALAAQRPNLNLLARDKAVFGTREGIWRLNSSPEDTDAIAIERVFGTGGTEESDAFVLGDFARLGAFLRCQLGVVA